MELQDAVPGLDISDSEEINGQLVSSGKSKARKVSFPRDEKPDYDDADESDDDDREIDLDDDDDEGDSGVVENGDDLSDDDEEDNPLLTDLDGDKKKNKTDIWFNKVNTFLIIYLKNK